METNEKTETDNVVDVEVKPEAKPTTTETEKKTPPDKTFSQEDLDRILTDRLARDRSKLEKEITSKVKREQEERQLLEDQKWKELAERRETELAELKVLQETVEREKKVQSLLDKKEVTEPQFRKMFFAMNYELQELSDTVDSFNTVFQSAVEKAVAVRLGNTSPSKTNGQQTANKPISKMTDTEKVAFISEHGQDKFTKAVMAEFATEKAS